MKLALERPHEKYGSTMFQYTPHNIPFNFTNPTNFENQRTKIVIDNFNSHNSKWDFNETSGLNTSAEGYSPISPPPIITLLNEKNQDGEEVEKWAEANDLIIIHDINLPPSLNSNSWRIEYNQDIISKVKAPIPNSQHRPIKYQINAIISSENVLTIKCYNFKKTYKRKLKDTTGH
ncbi:anaphase-promoting complex subunit 1-like [Aphis craccivora]|uniref:Anaphase-promoting complex subunit 1-like n=1 Tax=Aphis craccivora TaxID=307492 RepID=A0A6G0ZAN4_APHCR|nr:anaphase-promoting complex subunit 1-like [Aphis craccivora]